MALIYPAGDEQQTLNLGLSTWGMDEVLAQNMILIDTAFGVGSSVRINGSVISSPNFVNSATVTFSVAGSNVSATAASGGTPGGSTGDIQYNSAGVFGGSAATINSAGSLTIPIGQSIILNGGLTDSASSTGIFGQLLSSTSVGTEWITETPIVDGGAFATNDTSIRPVWIRQGILLQGTSYQQFSVEEPTVLYDANPILVSGDVFGNCYKMWAHGGWAANNTYYAESTDGIHNWVWYGGVPTPTVVLASHRQPCVIRINPTTLWMYAQLPGTGGIDLYSSSSGTSWSLVASGVLPKGGAGTWDSGGIYNPDVKVISGIYYMAYGAGPGTGNPQYSMGVATSPDGKVWTKSASNPVLPGFASPSLQLIGAEWYVWSSGPANNYAAIPSDMYRAKSATFGSGWAIDNLGCPVMIRRTADEGADFAQGQIADPYLLQTNTGQVYMYYDASPYQGNPNNINLGAFSLKLAIADMTFAELVTTAEGSAAGLVLENTLTSFSMCVTGASLSGTALTLTGPWIDGASNSFVGLYFTITGFISPALGNNGYWIATASSAGSITVTVPSGGYNGFAGEPFAATSQYIVPGQWIPGGFTNPTIVGGGFSPGSALYLQHSYTGIVDRSTIGCNVFDSSETMLSVASTSLTAAAIQMFASVNIGGGGMVESIWDTSGVQYPMMIHWLYSAGKGITYFPQGIINIGGDYSGGINLTGTVASGYNRLTLGTSPSVADVYLNCSGLGINEHALYADFGGIAFLWKDSTSHEINFSADGNGIVASVVNTGGVSIPNGSVFGIGAVTSGTHITVDTSISRLAAGSLGIGTGAAGSVAGNLSLNRVNVAGIDFAGTATITAAGTSVTVTYAANYTGAAAPVVVVTPTSDPLAAGIPVGYWVTAVGSGGAWTGFTVSLQTALAGNITFNFIAIGKA